MCGIVTVAYLRACWLALYVLHVGLGPRDSVGASNICVLWGVDSVGASYGWVMWGVACMGASYGGLLWGVWVGVGHDRDVGVGGGGRLLVVVRPVLGRLLDE